EVIAMVRGRRFRTAAWALTLAGALAALLFVEVEDRPGGPFQTRAVVRAEVRAPVSGFLREVCFDEGEQVSPGAVVARLEIPDLDTRTAQAVQAAREAEARLRLLEIGP